MHKKILAFLSIFVLIFSTFTISFAQVKKVKSPVTVKQQVNSLAALLPASDGVINIDMKRLMTDAIPQILSANPAMLAEINGKIKEVQTQTGLDLRQFEQVAVGVAIKQISDKEVDFAPLILARGKFNSGSLLETAKTAAKGKFREEKIGDKTAYIFSAQEIVQDNKTATGDSKLGKMVDRVLSSLKNEIAVTAFDANTIAIGTLPRMQETLVTKTRISSDVLSFLNRKPNAVMSFGANTPVGISQFFKLDEDEIGKMLAGVRSLYGAMDIVNTNVTVSLTAKSAEVQNAKDMEEALSGLQMVGKGLLGGSKGADKEVYARMIENAKITRNMTEVILNLEVPQTDINILLGKK